MPTFFHHRHDVDVFVEPPKGFEEFYKDKLQGMEVSSELVWVEERGNFKKAGPWRRKSSDAKGDDFADTTEKRTKPNQVTVSTSTTNPPGSSPSLARSKADASTSSVSSESDQVAGEGEKPRERLKKNLQKLKIRSRLKSAHKSKPREGELRSSDEDLTGFPETSSAKACDAICNEWHRAVAIATVVQAV